MKNRKDLLTFVGLILLLIGTLLPSIRIAQENINFLKENGVLTLVLIVSMFILVKLEKKELIIIPSAMSLSLIIKFILNNIDRLNEINKMYNCYAKFQYGLAIMIIGNIVILLSVYLPYLKLNKSKEKIKATEDKIKNIISDKKEKITNKVKTQKENKKVITPALIQKLMKKENKKTITQETTKDGKIKYNKITVKVDKKEKTLKEKFNDLILKLRLKKISKKNLSLSKYKEETKKTKTYYVPTIDIKKWTRSDVSCINCGAKVNSSSEYCFLCDCKIKLTDKEEKLS